MGGVVLTDGGLNIWASATDLTNWTELPSGTSTVNREATEKIEGDFSCRFDVDASNSAVNISQPNIPLTPLKKYKLIIPYMHSVAGKTSKFTLADYAGASVYLQDDGTWGAVHEIELENSIVWKRFELAFSAHADYSSYRLLLNRKTSASSSIYFDDVGIYYSIGGGISMFMDMKL